MSSSVGEALATIRAALLAINTWWEGVPWPEDEIAAAAVAVARLARCHAEIGTKEEREVRGIESMTAVMIAWAKIERLTEIGPTHPGARSELVALLGDMAALLAAPAAVMGANASRSQQVKARNLRKEAETKKLYELASEAAAEWKADPSRQGRKLTAAWIIRKAGRRFYGCDEDCWPVSYKALYERMRRYVKTKINNR